MLTEETSAAGERKEVGRGVTSIAGARSRAGGLEPERIPNVAPQIQDGKKLHKKKYLILRKRITTAQIGQVHLPTKGNHNVKKN